MSREEEEVGGRKEKKLKRQGAKVAKGRKTGTMEFWIFLQEGTEGKEGDEEVFRCFGAAARSVLRCVGEGEMISGFARCFRFSWSYRSTELLIYRNTGSEGSEVGRAKKEFKRTVTLFSSAAKTKAWRSSHMS